MLLAFQLIFCQDCFLGTLKKLKCRLALPANFTDIWIDEGNKLVL